MESKIIKEEKNPFLERTEITLEIKSEIAPSFEDVKAAIGKDAKLTVVKKINSHFGKQIFVADVVVYDSKEAKEKIETVPKKVRKKMAEEAKSAEAAAKKAEAEAKAVKEAAKKAEAEAKVAEEAPVEAEAPAEEPVPEAETPVEETASADVPSEEGKEEVSVEESVAEEKTE